MLLILVVNSSFVKEVHCLDGSFPPVVDMPWCQCGSVYMWSTEVFWAASYGPGRQLRGSFQ